MTSSATDIAVAAMATKYRVPYANLRAVVEIESDGVVSAHVNGRNEPLIRFEGHYFDRRLTSAAQATARAMGLANPKAGAVANPNSQQARWDKLLTPAMKINRNAALESCSWGLGQVMCSHWKALGYQSADHFVTTARSGVAGQVQLMMQYCVEHDLLDELQRGDFTAFARAYNGPAYAKHNYDGRMRSAALEFAKGAQPSKYDGGSIPPVVITDNGTMLAMGAKGARVRELQALLVRAGQTVKVDGDYGPSTRYAVRVFQITRDLKADGIVGPQTWNALDAYRVEGEARPGSVPPGEVVAGTKEGQQGALAALLAAVAAAISNAVPDGTGTVLAYAAVAAVIGAAAWIGYGYWKANREDK